MICYKLKNYHYNIQIDLHTDFYDKYDHMQYTSSTYFYNLLKIYFVIRQRSYINN